MEPIIDDIFLLRRFEGKGGWTYTHLPAVALERSKHFGWVKLRGFIDGYEFRKYHLMPTADGRLFFPVKAEIRRKIGKQAGDKVRIIVFPDQEPLQIPDEFLLCLHDEPAAFEFFHSLSENEQKFYINWIYSAKKAETKDERLARAINRLSRKLRMSDKA